MMQNWKIRNGRAGMHLGRWLELIYPDAPNICQTGMLTCVEGSDQPAMTLKPGTGKAIQFSLVLLGSPLDQSVLYPETVTGI